MRADVLPRGVGSPILVARVVWCYGRVPVEAHVVWCSVGVVPFAVMRKILCSTCSRSTSKSRRRYSAGGCAGRVSIHGDVLARYRGTPGLVRGCQCSLVGSTS